MRLLAANLDFAAADRREAAQRKISNFNSHRKRLRYGIFRKQGYFIGSRIIKMGCMAVIWHRLKQPSVFWGDGGAENVPHLRFLLNSPNFEAAYRPAAPSSPPSSPMPATGEHPDIGSAPTTRHSQIPP